MDQKTKMQRMRNAKAAKKKRKQHQTKVARNSLKNVCKKQNIQQMINRLKSQIAARDLKIRELQKTLKNLTISNTKIKNKHIAMLKTHQNGKQNKLQWLKHEIKHLIHELQNKIDRIPQQKYVTCNL